MPLNLHLYVVGRVQQYFLSLRLHILTVGYHALQVGPTSRSDKKSKIDITYALSLPDNYPDIMSLCLFKPLFIISMFERFTELTCTTQGYTTYLVPITSCTMAYCRLMTSFSRPHKSSSRGGFHMGPGFYALFI